MNTKMTTRLELSDKDFKVINHKNALASIYEHAGNK